MPTKKDRLNLKNIEANLAEAIEQLEKLRTNAADGDLNETDLQVGLLHAYHHINFAWNTRHTDTPYARMTQVQFKRWGKYPSKIEKL